MMYTFMARCEQLNTNMKDLHAVAEQMYPFYIVDIPILNTRLPKKYS